VIWYKTAPCFEKTQIVPRFSPAYLSALEVKEVWEANRYSVCNAGETDRD